MNRRQFLQRGAYALGAAALCGCGGPARLGAEPNGPAIEHVRIYHRAGRYAGWPANHGMWAWGDELLVGFTEAAHLDRPTGHTYDRTSARHKFARSRDGGRTWDIEDAFEHGMTAEAFEHRLGDRAQPVTALNEPMRFTHPDFALTLRMHDLRDGPSSFYFSYDRGRTWRGAFELVVPFPDPQPAGIVTRTDYVVDGEHALTAWLTVGFREGKRNWREVACVRTRDGGMSWEHVAWLGKRGVNAIMPASVRLSPTTLLTTIRLTDPPRMACYRSDDNGATWRALDDPTRIDGNGNPPALVRLRDGRLCLVYALRDAASSPHGIGVYARLSDDDGRTWRGERLLRGGDGTNWDIGYARAAQRADGHVVAVYYYNQAGLNTDSPYRYLAATIFNPAAL